MSQNSEKYIPEAELEGNQPERKEGLSFDVAVASLKGTSHTRNQDSFLLDRERKRYFVADGMGGHSYGKEASQLACGELSQKLDGIDKDNVREELPRVVVEIAAVINKKWQNDKGEGTAGTTLSGLVEVEGQMWLVHVGDSRVFRVRDGQAEQLTNDHTMAFEGGVKPEDDCYKYLNRFLARSVGVSELVPGQVDVIPIKNVQPDVIFVIASDGLFKDKNGLIEDPGKWLMESLEPEIAAGKDCNMMARHLAEKAQEVGCRDDITAMVVRACE